MSEEDKGELPPAEKSAPLLERIVLSEAQRGSLTAAEWAQKWAATDTFINHLEDRIASMEAELTTAKAAEDRNKLQVTESQQRERILIRRIATKDQEIQDCMNQIAELKAAQAPGASALRTALLDPAVNLVLHRLRQEVTALKTRLEETQNELSAWKFTPDSNTGKRLMAKCRLLYQENEELGRVVSSGRLAKLEGDLALQKSFSEEVKKSQSELDEFLQDLDEDVEGMQSTIYFLQQELKKTKEALAELQQEKTSLKSTPSGNASPLAVAATSGDAPAASCDFRTGPPQLTNGKHSAVCGRSSVKEAGAEQDKGRTNHGDSSSDSSEVLRFEAGDLCDEVDQEVSGHRRDRKRTFGKGRSEDDSSNDSDNAPLVKKGRRGSELSLDYNEDELCLTNGDVKADDH